MWSATVPKDKNVFKTTSSELNFDVYGNINNKAEIFGSSNGIWTWQLWDYKPNEVEYTAENEWLIDNGSLLRKWSIQMATDILWPDLYLTICQEAETD